LSNNNSILKVIYITTRFLTQDGVVNTVNCVTFNLKRVELRCCRRKWFWQKLCRIVSSQIITYASCRNSLGISRIWRKRPY